jgi:hypothetical protein
MAHKQGIREERKEGTMMRRKKKPNIRGGGMRNKRKHSDRYERIPFYLGPFIIMLGSLFSLTYGRPASIYHTFFWTKASKQLSYSIVHNRT